MTGKKYRFQVLKLRGKNQKAVMSLLRDPYYVEISLRRIASEVLETPMYTDTQYNSIRKTVNQLENDKKLIESKTIPLSSKKYGMPKVIFLGVSLLI